jgi:Ca-activated chloride channel family protein
MRSSRLAATAAALGLIIASPHAQDNSSFKFRSGVELINVTATVSDVDGRFVPNLTQDDFVVYEDDQRVDVTHFNAERVPVSLGIALDTSGSMAGEKITAAETALNRFLFDLLGPKDPVFLYRFSSQPDLVQGWTTDRHAVSRALGSVRPAGGTALYDTIADAIPLAQAGTERKKALVVISDGNDTSSHTGLAELRQVIRESEVLVYAIGIDAGGDASGSTSSKAPAARPSAPVPAPFPGQKPPAAPPPTSSSRPTRGGSSDRVNADALRQITDDSGGRTEIIVSHRDLDPATAGIADELSKQYFLGYVSSAPKDGRWHSIEVRVRKGNYLVRARRGFMAERPASSLK